MSDKPQHPPATDEQRHRELMAAIEGVRRQQSSTLDELKPELSAIKEMLLWIKKRFQWFTEKRPE